MSDLVQRLRESEASFSEVDRMRLEAADRIEVLELALRAIVTGSPMNILRAMEIAKYALEAR